jgi:ATP phosphoribosyltransferase
MAEMHESKLRLAVPAKGRLKDQTANLFDRARLGLRKTDRGYRGSLDAFNGVEVVFLSAQEIVHHLRSGSIHLGITGEDLVRETIANADAAVEFVAPLGFGKADVVVAVPDCWLDVSRMADLEDVAVQFLRVHGRRLRVATKYMNLTCRFFARHGVSGYRILESAGATEAAPAAGTAELIVDITSTGSTLRANHLKVLDDGLILRSQANLIASKAAPGGDPRRALQQQLLDALNSAPPVST